MRPNNDERQDGECRIEKRSTRPVVQRAARTPHRPDDNERKQKRPDPAQPAEDAITRPENEKRKARDAEAQAWDERPGLRLVCASTS